ncbi:hypothetical protein NKV53_03545 [Legionella sp. 27cVA30]|uniref:hypothetical protein n=1 Tax=Legionella sp. 27cVA30 TaxID=2905657 RepID=UPI00209C7982|nr:hypothetical protein [Legionella sp. 27cVA30]MCP0913440.1 hypothetical protein [Legionella sp. 27cVA30]
MIQLARLIFMMVLGINAAASFAAVTIEQCVNVKKAEAAGRDLIAMFEQDVCRQKTKPVLFADVVNIYLPQVMNENFLGVPPPANWQLLADDVVTACTSQSDVCLKEVRKEIASCITGRLPGILLVFGPWFAENCEMLNKHVILNWDNKKAIIQGWLQQSQTSNGD